MKHIGMDVHSTTTVATVLSDRGRKLLRRQIPTREFDLIDFMRNIPGPKRVALEESQMADFVTRAIAPYVTEVIRCQPQHNRLISESECRQIAGIVQTSYLVIWVFMNNPRERAPQRRVSGLYHDW